MTDAVEVARYLVDLADRDPDGEGLAPPRLHRLLYLAQGWHVAAFDRPLFADPLLAGPNGPEVAAVRDAAQAAVANGRPLRPGDLGACGLSFRDRRFADAVWEKYRGYSAAGLREVVAEGGDAPAVSVDALRRRFASRPELAHFDPREWERLCDGEADIEAGRTVTLAETLTRLRTRCGTS